MIIIIIITIIIIIITILALCIFKKYYQSVIKILLSVLFSEKKSIAIRYVYYNENPFLY